MSPHPDIQEGGCVAIRDRRPPWSVSGDGPRWPERVTPEQARRVEELLTEIETLTGVRSQGGGQ